MRSFVAVVGSSPKLLLLKISQPMRRLRTPSTDRRRRRRSNPHSVVSCYSSWRLCRQTIHEFLLHEFVFNKQYVQCIIQYVYTQVRSIQYVHTRCTIKRSVKWTDVTTDVRIYAFLRRRCRLVTKTAVAKNIAAKLISDRNTSVPFRLGMR